MDFTPYLDMMIRHGASDIFVTAGSPVRIKIEGRLRDIGEAVYSPEMCRDAVASLMNDAQGKVFSTGLLRMEVEVPDDVARAVAGRGRVPPGWTVDAYGEVGS